MRQALFQPSCIRLVEDISGGTEKIRRGKNSLLIDEGRGLLIPKGIVEERWQRVVNVSRWDEAWQLRLFLESSNVRAGGSALGDE